MATVTGPLHSIEAQGSLGAMTFYRGRAAQCVRLRWPGIRRRSVAASIPRRSMMTAVASAWKNLSPSLKARWIQFAKNFPLQTQRGRKISGMAQAHFFKLSMARALVGRLPLLAPPRTPSCSFHPAIKITFDNNRFWLHFSDELPSERFFIVRQKRNLMPSNSHTRWAPIWGIIAAPAFSPFPISDPVDQPSTMPGFPPIQGGFHNFFEITVQDNFGRRMPRRTFFEVAA